MPSIKIVLRLFFGLTYLLVLFLVSGTIEFKAIYAENILTFFFLLATVLMYGVFYLLPAYCVTQLTQILLKTKLQQSIVYKKRYQTGVYAVAILTSAITTLIFYANAKLYALYGMHINGFVFNLVFTPGGIASLGGSAATDASFALIGLGFLLLQLCLLYFAIKFSRTHIFSKLESFKQISNKPTSKKLTSNLQLALIALFAVFTLHMTFAFDRFTSNGLASVAQAVPFYQTVSSRGLFRAMGIEGRRDTSLKIKGKLNYPLHAIKYNKPAKPFNIIWLTAESWRADTLNEHIMPNTWQFAKQSTRFTQHYSGGNGTRAGVFSLFMGMPASYWFQFLQEQRGAAIIDVMQKQHYQMRFYTSGLFSYPEFDRTIFAQVSEAKMQALQRNGKISWQNDQQNVSDLLHFIDKRDTTKPFFTFMFFESPHARYFFPTESVIAKPYRDDLNYATLSKESLHQDIVPIKNRYINSVHHLDSQYKRVFDYLKDKKLLDSTIVILVGDHGEEFMEHGFWGHNSTFVDEQVRTPLVIYAPKNAAKVIDRLTSHSDIVPTIMPMLGVINPQSDYSIGFNLFGNEVRDHVYIADWDRLAYVDKDVKIVQPVNSKAFFMRKISTRKDIELNGTAFKAMLARKQDSNMQIMRDLSHFTKKSVETKLK